MLFTWHFSCYKVKEKEEGRECHVWERFVQIFFFAQVKKKEGPLGKPRHEWEGNFKTGHKTL
jgi:hypothetical protein